MAVYMTKKQFDAALGEIGVVLGMALPKLLRDKDKDFLMNTAVSLAHEARAAEGLGSGAAGKLLGAIAHGIIEATSTD